MDLFKNEHGYEPLVVNLEGFWDKSFSELPGKLQSRVRQAMPRDWDEMTIENRRRNAAGYDYNRDPNNEPALLYQLCLFASDLDEWIASEDKKDGREAVARAYEKVKKRIEAMFEDGRVDYVDREEIGNMIKAARAGEVKRITHSTEALEGKSRTTALKIIGGMAMDGYGMDIHASRLNISRLVDELAKAGVSVDPKTLSGWIKDAAEVVEPKKK